MHGEGNGGAAGPHYNSQVWPAGTLTAYADAVKSPKTEVWFDLVPSEEDGRRDQAPGHGALCASGSGRRHVDRHSCGVDG
jgi:hypothetical protein